MKVKEDRAVKKRIRLATKNDCTSILEIYAPFVTDTTVTFEYEVPTIEDFEKRIINTQKKYLWLVCEIEDKIVGYAYAHEFMDREAYDWSVICSIYINPEYQGKRIGKALYFSLLELLKLQGFYNAYACITASNTKSERFHEAFDFTQVGIHPNAGYKFGKWLDIKWYGVNITKYHLSPNKPKAIYKISGTPEFESIIQKAEQMIR